MIAAAKTDKNDQVTYLHPLYQNILPSLNFVEDIWEGRNAWMGDDLRIKDKAKALLYLPPSAGESRDMAAKGDAEGYYYDRLRRSLFPRFFRNAIEKDFAGLLSRFEPVNLHPSIKANINNIDLLGNSLKVFLKEADQLALRDGGCFIFVENPPSDPNLTTLRDELESDRRPYLILIPRGNVINWQLGNNNELTLIVVLEKLCIPDGLFGSKTIYQYRVFRKVAGVVLYQIWRRNEDDKDKDYSIVEESIISLPQIPIVPYSLHCGNLWFNQDFPLKDLAEMNLRWYQLDSEIIEMIHYCQPTLLKKPSETVDRHSAANATNNEDVSVGARVCLEGEYSWLEPTGAGIVPAQNERQKVEDVINSYSMSFLQGSHLVKTATQVDIEAAQIETNLQLLAYLKESNVEVIFRYWANWLGSNNGGTINVNKKLVNSQSSVVS